jgi:site-specific recombinase XerD
MNFNQAKEKFDMVAGRKLQLTTQRSYWTWLAMFLRFLGTAEAKDYTTSEARIERFLSDMAREDYSWDSQNQAFNGILFFYRNVLKVELKDIDALRCKRKKSIRYTPTEEEMLAILHHLKNSAQYHIRLAGALMYSCGLRVSECCQLRIKDFDLERMVLTVHDGKGFKDRVVAISELLAPAIRKHLARARALAEIDIADRQPVQLPGRMDRKFRNLQFDPEWFFIFPSAEPCAHPRTGKMVRWCMSPDVMQRSFAAARKSAGIRQRITPHCARHAFCSHLMDRGENIKRVAEAMGHVDIRTTAGYGRKDCEAMVSPLDRIVNFPMKEAKRIHA